MQLLFKITVLSKHWQFTCTWLELALLETRKNLDWVLCQYCQSYFKMMALQLSQAVTKIACNNFLGGFLRSYEWLLSSYFRGITMQFYYILYRNDSTLSWRQIKRRLILMQQEILAFLIREKRYIGLFFIIFATILSSLHSYQHIKDLASFQDWSNDYLLLHSISI